MEAGCLAVKRGRNAVGVYPIVATERCDNLEAPPLILGITDFYVRREIN
jgi:hypothetical protein